MGLFLIVTPEVFLMAGIFRLKLQFAALSPLTTWAVVQAVRARHHRRRAVLLYASLAALLLFAHWALLDGIRAGERARRLGCRPVRRDPRPKGELVAAMRAAFRAHRVLDALRARLDDVGRTFVDGGTWGEMIVTDEPEIIRTVQSARFEDWDIAGPRLWSAVQNFGRRSIFTNNGAKCKTSFDLDLEAGECEWSGGEEVMLVDGGGSGVGEVDMIGKLLTVLDHQGGRREICSSLRLSVTRSQTLLPLIVMFRGSWSTFLRMAAPWTCSPFF